MNTVDKIKAAWRARQIFNAFEKEHKRMGDYDFKKTVAKAVKDFLITVLAVASASAGAALGEYFQNRENIEAAIAVLRGFARETPMPSWVQYAQKGTDNSNCESNND